ncbi:aminodeoxychorismate synthase component I [Rhodohalobacter halophilus]|uniref:aminodeoxychorismate synthase component I n=1 Tax=Rhodohalobacter halophilus TaxID=1812810 RepID=UPI00083F8A9B|nr:aminodeoxychorismate synthase component I [Rhodohalobacter halophilus]
MKFSGKNSVDQIVSFYAGENYILLESQMEGHPSSGQSFVAIRPRREIFGYGEEVTWIENGERSVSSENPWDSIQKFHERSESLIFGYIGYDLKNYIERVESDNPALIDVPDFYFMEPEILIQVREGEAETVNGEVDLDQIASHGIQPISGFIGEIHRLEEKQHYIRKIEEVQRRIREGDFYELNYSYPVEGKVKGDPLALYRKMREVNPVPFGAFIKTDDFQVCSASPERFLKKSGRKVVSEPIKGTAPTSSDPAENHRQKEILQNEKNKAENLMIVDLVRHDLSLIAETGSVRVSKLFDVQTFGTVHQLISTVEATALDGLSPVQIIKACFPMGSMTGAPKIEVMKVIDELESYRRGIYSGAIGYISPDGDFDFNVVIRSAIIQEEKFIYPVGGAITSDSIPEEEWEETHVKTRAITKIAEKNGSN